MSAGAHDLGDVAIPQQGILSRTLHADAAVKVVTLALAPGEELSEHAAAMPATLQVVRGRAELGLGPERIDAGVGTWVHMAPGLVHSVRAIEPTVVLLTLIKDAAR